MKHKQGVGFKIALLHFEHCRKVLISFFDTFSKKHKRGIVFKAAFLHFEHCRATPKGGQDLAPGDGERPSDDKSKGSCHREDALLTNCSKAGSCEGE